jgi:hypothetical protein
MSFLCYANESAIFGHWAKLCADIVRKLDRTEPTPESSVSGSEPEPTDASLWRR